MGFVNVCVVFAILFLTSPVYFQFPESKSTFCSDHQCSQSITSRSEGVSAIYEYGIRFANVTWISDKYGRKEPTRHVRKKSLSGQHAVRRYAIVIDVTCTFSGFFICTLVVNLFY